MKRFMMSGDNLEQLTTELGEAYRLWKDNEERKNKLKGEFFEALTAQIDRSSAATQVVHVNGAENMEQARATALRKYPGWKVTGVHLEALDDGDYYYVGLQEDLSCKTASYVNPTDGMVYQRSVVEGSIMLDDEAIKEGNPQLWRLITRTKVVEEVIPLEELDPSLLEQIAPYLYKEAPMVKLLAPRPAKEDELEI